MDRFKNFFLRLFSPICKSKWDVQKVAQQNGNDVAHVTFTTESTVTTYRIHKDDRNSNLDTIIADLETLNPCKIKIRLDKDRDYIYIEYPDNRIRQYTGQEI